jgi:ribA/ribD-fused uncharacterized protein
VSKIIDSFSGEYYFLSNFYPWPIHYEGLTYPSVEHAYQAHKSTDVEVHKRFTDKNMTAAQAKRLGRELTLTFDWEDRKLPLMEDLLKIKFSGSFMAHTLLNTKDAELVEGNWWNDTYWGVCKGVGHNHLGRLLMKVRSEL